MILTLWDLSYDIHLNECGVTTLEARRLGGYEIVVFKILNGYENIDRNICSQCRKVELEDMKLH